jgi:DNA repair exonuclease SbcCD ATPase subunit
VALNTDKEKSEKDEGWVFLLAVRFLAHSDGNATARQPTAKAPPLPHQTPTTFLLNPPASQFFRSVPCLQHRGTVARTKKRGKAARAGCREERMNLVRQLWAVDEVDAMAKGAPSLRRKGSLPSPPPQASGSPAAPAPAGAGGGAGGGGAGGAAGGGAGVHGHHGHLPQKASAVMSGSGDGEEEGEGQQLEERAKEYERRIDVLTFCLEEKVMENENLLKRLEMYAAAGHARPGAAGGGGAGQDKGAADKVKSLEAVVKQKEDEVEELQEGKFKLEEEKEELRRRLNECQKKLDSAVAELQEAVSDQQASSAGAEGTAERDGGGVEGGKNWEDKYKQEKKDKKRMEELVFSHEETIERLKHGLKSKEKKYRLALAKLDKEKEKREALVESNEEYEKRFQAMEKDLMDALHKEGERRMEAEYWQDNMRKKLKKLKKKLKKLEKKESKQQTGDDKGSLSSPSQKDDATGSDDNSDDDEPTST